MTEFGTWPSDQDYIDAVQAPGVCFSDSNWRSAQFDSDGFGMPLYATGRSAIVFHAKIGQADYALRCFTRSTANQKERYEKLSLHLKQGSSLGSFVRFRYWEDAILVGPRRYPVVEMAWSQGVPLNDWVAGRLKKSDELVGLAKSWLGVTGDLWERQIAHGDLANDNCLVSGSGITLVDYDSCFIPSLKRVDPGEEGNENFQHPHRDGYYALDMDSFPSLVIYLSLLALSRHRSLWQQFNTGNNLIFTKNDYLKPRKTEVWKELNRTGDQDITSLAGTLAEMCDSRVASFPPLSELVARKSLHRDQGPSWIDELMQIEESTPERASRPPASAEGWWEDWPGEKASAASVPASVPAATWPMPAWPTPAQPVRAPVWRRPAARAAVAVLVALIVVLVIIV